MSFEHRQQVIGLAMSLVAFATYWIVVTVRGLTDDLPFTQVAWQGPMLWTLVLGGAIYAVIYGASRWRSRGQRVTDVRDAQILMQSESAGGGIVGLTVLATLIMLALGADYFWVANVLFVGSFLGSLAGSGAAIAAYQEGFSS